MLEQLWQCDNCKTIRQWGEGQAPDPAIQPLLVCEGTCSKQVESWTAHSYVGVKQAA